MTFQEFWHVGSASFVTGTVGVIVPFLFGYAPSALLGFTLIESIVVASALVATSVSITSLVLVELGKIRTIEARVIIGAAVVHDMLGLAILGVIVSFISSGATLNPFSVILVVLESLALWLGLVLVITPLLTRLINITAKGESEGTVEAAATSSCFGGAAIAALIGLSPIVGAFAAGMAVASSNAIVKIREYARKISVIFSPVFFALAGAQFNFRSFVTSDWGFSVFFFVFTIVAIVSKVVGCGVPAWLMLKDRGKGLKVGVSMISRGEVGLIVEGVAISAGVVSQSVYSALVSVVIVTTILAPLRIQKAYNRDKSSDDKENAKATEDQTRNPNTKISKNN
jgi:Kef-type K+ transport system membrane component KefB